MKISAVIAVKNEEAFLENCLKSVAFCDEIVVLDSGSTDKTLEIAKKHKAKIIEYEWQGFRFAHNFGAEQASGDWLLYLDADERVSKKLRTQIQKVIKNPEAQAYQIPRKNFFLGQAMDHGGWYPDLVTRLIKKESLKEWVSELHEYPLIDGLIQQLNGDLYHLSHRSMEWKLHKSISYTKMYAQILKEANHPPVRVKNFFGAMIREFYARAIKQKGYKDGFVGWLEIIDQTFNAFLVQAQLWELQQNKSMTQQYKEIDNRISKEFD